MVPIGTPRTLTIVSEMAYKCVQEKARDLGVVIDSRLSLSDHVASVCRSCYYQLRQLRPVVRCSSEDATKTLVQAFIASRLDYCNVLYYGIYNELIRRLQSVQNAADGYGH